MTFVIEFLFTMLEGVRIHALEHRAFLQTQTAVESAFGSYNSSLWEQYHILARDMQGMEETIIDMASSSMVLSEEGIHLLNFIPKEVQITKYRLLTDDSGRSYIKSVSNYMKEHVLYEGAQGIYSQFEAVKSILDKNSVDNLDIEKALKSLNEKENGVSVESSSFSKDSRLSNQVSLFKNSNLLTNVDSSYYFNLLENANCIYHFDLLKKLNFSHGLDLLDNLNSLYHFDILKIAKNINSQEIQKKGTSILESASNLQKMGILQLVIEDNATISSNIYEEKERVSKRQLLKGTDTKISEITWFDTILLQQYLLKYLGNYTKEMKSTVLSYEVEYLIGKKESDIENLKSVISQILTIRQAINMMYLLSDSAKMQTITTFAGILAGVTGNPIVLELVKTGLVTAWAFGESILDIRALLQGKKIPFIKNETLWTLELEQIENLSTSFLTAKESQKGMSYEDYLGILLFFQKAENLALYAMDIQEAVMQQQKGYEDFKMDRMVTGIGAEINYTYSFLFLSMQNLISYDDAENIIDSQTVFSYW